MKWANAVRLSVLRPQPIVSLEILEISKANEVLDREVLVESKCVKKFQIWHE